MTKSDMATLAAIGSEEDAERAEYRAWLDSMGWVPIAEHLRDKRVEHSAGFVDERMWLAWQASARVVKQAQSAINQSQKNDRA